MRQVLPRPHANNLNCNVLAAPKTEKTEKENGNRKCQCKCATLAHSLVCCVCVLFYFMCVEAIMNSTRAKNRGKNAALYAVAVALSPPRSLSHLRLCRIAVRRRSGVWKIRGKLHCIAFVAAIMGEHFPKGEDGEDARPPDYWLAQFEAKAKRVHNGNLSNGAKYADISLFTQTSHRNSDPCSQMENLERSK